jgi:2-(1,2-epoxy-1,2-dihydrophenyl)acetyl-CoA isomerase
MPETVSEEVLGYAVSRGVAWLRLNRPASRNAIEGELRAALVAATARAARDPEVRVVVLAGEGSAFCAGADLTRFGDPGEGVDAIRGEYEALLTRLRTMPKPTLAAVRGAAAGIGVSIACCCDMRYAADDAFFRVAFVDIGLTVDGGVSWLLPRLVGLGRAFEMCYTGRRVGAEEAERWGLVNRVVASDELEDAVRELAERLASGPAGALGAIKRSLTYAATSGFEEAVDFEFLLQSVQTQGADFREGVTAFLEKREPRFQGG